MRKIVGRDVKTSGHRFPRQRQAKIFLEVVLNGEKQIPAATDAHFQPNQLFATVTQQRGDHQPRGQRIGLQADFVQAQQQVRAHARSKAGNALLFRVQAFPVPALNTEPQLLSTKQNTQGGGRAGPLRQRPFSRLHVQHL